MNLIEKERVFVGGNIEGSTNFYLIIGRDGVCAVEPVVNGALTFAGGDGYFLNKLSFFVFEFVIIPPEG